MTSFWRGVGAHLNVILKVRLCQKLSRKPTNSKMKNLWFCLYIHNIVRVGPPHTRPKSMKILSRSSLFSRPKIDSEIKRFRHQKSPQKRPLKSGAGPVFGAFGTPWGPPRDPGPEIDDSELDFGAYFGPRAWDLRPNLLQIDAQNVLEGHIRAILCGLTSWIDLTD